ncbi:histidine triad family protein [Deferribacter desulfuricans SSM1]|uniref:Histidine triad family protein n=1 Tax=Deferribacter desulfuricans (strain DSM 14783 / JCM 11476 / NBRC 101012 / SSM1) TaxID=639282 RepID=D3PAS7_DEFDS|nr:HIT domain-containing protein [Deferribacter desulfuricans]BAI79700.1 histidine triad family protein [Deferribacter desulfuricans SSM1]
MDRLWAPWRMTYISGDHIDEGCIFCNKPKETKDKENLILFRGEYSFIMMNLFPYNNGHLMVAPYKHTGNLEDLNDNELLEMMKLVQKSIKAMKRCMRPDGFNTGFNIGRAAGAGIADHVHFHVVPRWVGDTNFMPTLAGTKVISEHILKTYDKIYKELHLEDL